MSGRSSTLSLFNFFNTFFIRIGLGFSQIKYLLKDNKSRVELTSTDFILMISDILNLLTAIFGQTIKKAQRGRKSQEKEQCAVSSTSKTTAPSPDAILCINLRKNYYYGCHVEDSVQHATVRKEQFPNGLSRFLCLRLAFAVRVFLSKLSAQLQFDRSRLLVCDVN